MDAKRISSLMAGAGAFVAAVALGAFVIVSLSPGETRLLGAQQGLLIENAAPLKRFEERVRGAQPAPAVAPPRNVLADLPEPALPRLGPASPAAVPEIPPFEEAPTELKPSEPRPSEVKPPDPRPKVRPAEPAKAEPKPLRPAAPPVQAALPSAQPRPEGLLTPSEIRRMRLSLRLTREQEPYWGPVEQALLEISAQQSAMVRAGQDPKDAFGIGAGMRIYSVARPLLDQLREDQKAQVRARARAMGFGSIASSI